MIEFIKPVEKICRMLGKPHILSLFPNSFNKFNNTGARILDYIYHMTLNNFETYFRRENVRVLPYA